MANEKILNTRLQLKHDSLSAWNSSSIVLKPGEVGGAYVDVATKDANGNIIHVPTALLKIGENVENSTKTFKELPFVSALAADVYAWAKKEGIEVIDEGTGNVLSDVAWDVEKNALVLSRTAVATPDDLEEALENYYTKDEIDETILIVENNIINVRNRVTALEEKEKDYGDIVTHDVAEFATAAQGAKADAAAVKADVDAAFALRYTITEADAAIAAAEERAKKYADENDAQYHIVYDSTKKEIQLVAGADATKMTIDATAFIKDGMIETVELVQEDASGNKGQYLKLTWNDDGNDVTYVPVGELVDVYTAAANATEVQVAISNTNEVSATLVNGGVTTAKIADGAVTADKLANFAATTDKIDNGAITQTKIANAAVTSIKLDTDAVVTEKIKDAAVTTAKIADKAVTPDKLSETYLKANGSNVDENEFHLFTKNVLIGNTDTDSNDGGTPQTVAVNVPSFTYNDSEVATVDQIPTKPGDIGAAPAPIEGKEYLLNDGINAANDFAISAETIKFFVTDNNPLEVSATEILLNQKPVVVANTEEVYIFNCGTATTVI